MQPRGCPKLTSTYLLPSEMGTSHVFLPPCSLRAPSPHSLWLQEPKAGFFHADTVSWMGKQLQPSQLHCTARCNAPRSSPSTENLRGEETPDPTGSSEENKQPPHGLFRTCIRQKKLLQANPGQRLAHSPAVPLIMQHVIKHSSARTQRGTTRARCPYKYSS